MKKVAQHSISYLIILFCTTMSAQFVNPRNIPFNWLTDTSKHSVNLSEIQIVLPKNSFPKISNPTYVGKEEGLAMFFSKEPVLAVSINGQAKAFPLNMLTVHEMVNDNLGGVPILATYCPLCNSGIVYNRNLSVKGKTTLLNFEVSGMLRNSDMVMMDTKTETLWQQLTGEAIVGFYNKATLKVIPSMIVSVDEFFMRYPYGKILSKKTGIAKAEKYYGYNPYVNYDKKDGKPMKFFFSSNKIDKRLPAMERIVDIKSKGSYKIYPFSEVSKTSVINDNFKSAKVVVFYKKGTVSVVDKADIKNSRDVGTVTVFNMVLDGLELHFYKKENTFIDDLTQSKWDIMGYCYEGKLKGKQLTIEPHSNHFAFAWLAFHPNSKIFKFKK